MYIVCNIVFYAMYLFFLQWVRKLYNQMLKHKEKKKDTCDILSTSPLSPYCTGPSCIVSFTLNDDNGEIFGSRS